MKIYIGRSTEKFKANISAQCFGAEMTGEELLALIPQSKLAEIKLKEEHPVFKAWVVAHEGETNPELTSLNGRSVDSRQNVKVSFGAAAMTSLKTMMQSAIAKGLSFLSKHSLKDGKETNATKAGEAVAYAERQGAKGKEGIIVGYFPEESQKIANASDTVSMELDWIMDVVHDATGRIVEGFVDTVEMVKAIALGDTTKGDRPGFIGARELVSIQAFENAGEKKVMDLELKDFLALPFATFETLVTAYMSQRNVHATQLVSAEKLLGRRSVKNGRVLYEGGDREIMPHVERMENAFLDEKLRLEDSNKNLTNQLTQAQQSLAKYEVEPRIKEYAKKNALPEKILKLAMTELGDFKMGENPDQSIADFFEKMKAKDAKLAELGYVQQGSKSPSNGSGKTRTDDPNDPENNEFIPKEEK